MNRSTVMELTMVEVCPVVAIAMEGAAMDSVVNDGKPLLKLGSLL